MFRDDRLGSGVWASQFRVGGVGVGLRLANLGSMFDLRRT